MNALQYLAIGLASVAVIFTPFMLAKAIRRKQKYRIFEIPLAALVVVYIAVHTAFPAILASAPRPVHWLGFIVLLLWIADFFGLFRRLLNPQKAVPSERR